MNNLTIKHLFEESVRKNANNNCLSFVNSNPSTYSEVNNKVKELSARFQSLGVKKKDKVAILSENSPEWGITYLAAVSIGAVAVPILNDFSSSEIQTIINHSQSKVLLVSKKMQSKLVDIDKYDELKYVLDINSKSILQDFSKCSENEIIDYEITRRNKSQLKPVDVLEDDLAVIIYTSGTTGTSKGVMLSHKNIASNVITSYKVQEIKPSDRFLSILPLPHTYECTVGFLLPIAYGAAIYYISGPPTATVLIPALKKIRPTIMLSVPLIIEKIYNNKIAPKFRKGFVSKLYKIPPLRKMFNRIAGKKLMETFGGKIHFFGIGGALLDYTVEKFLFEAKFPYAIGYGLTETAPLIAGVNPNHTKFRSTGTAAPNVQLKIVNPNPETGEGEILAKGDNIMKGYYKNKKATKEVFTDDGWFKTGDLGVFDKDGFLYIKGRLKNMIVGPSGENIYPEEIESVINRHSLVSESIVYELKGKLVAKVHLNYEELEKRFSIFKSNMQDLHSDIEEHVNQILDDIKYNVNKEVNKFSRLALVMEHPTPFEKTPTQKIKKYLYISH